MELADTKAGAAAQKDKTAKVKDLLGKALSSGGQKITGLPDDADQAENVFQQWSLPVYDLIVAAYGVGEGAVFVSNAGLTFYSGSKANSLAANKIRGRLTRIQELLARVDGLTPQKDFDPAKFDLTKFE